MAAFATVGPCWHVEELGDECYHVYAVWPWSGRKLCGVAGGESLEDLLASAALSQMRRVTPGNRAKVPLALRFRVVRIGPTPGMKAIEHGIEVVVRPAEKGGWEVDQMRDVRRAAGKSKPKSKSKSKPKGK